MSNGKLGNLIKKGVTRIICILFRRHAIREDELIKFKNNPSKPYHTQCKTCNHPILAEVHPLDSKSYILLEI